MTAAPCILAVLLAASGFAPGLLAQTAPPRQLKLLIGRGELIQFERDISRVVVSEPKIADAVVVGPREVMVNAKGVGKATVIIWESGTIPAVYNVDVHPDSAEMESLRMELKQKMPNSNVVFTGNDQTMVLTGKVTSPEEAKRAEALASTQSKKVINLLEIPPPAEAKQILLQVKFASIDRTALTEMGVNFISRNPTMLGSLSTQQFQQPRISQLQFQNQDFANTTINFADLLNLFLFRPDINLGATVRALQQRNLLQILAEPNLIVVEGKEASFVAGGEFPFPTITSSTTGGAVSPVITVQFKKFGVQLGFTPTITHAGAINLKVAPEVSSLDFSNAVTLQGFQIPAINTRRAETEVVLKDGESFAIAGLIDQRVVNAVNKLPGLGDIPFVGKLFSSRSMRKSTDELLVVITPRFVRPLTPDEKAKLPETIEPFLPTAAEQKAMQTAKKKGKKDKAPEFVGPRGQQKPQQ